MWSLSHFSHRRAHRRRNAALIVLLGAYLPATLTPENQARVSSAVLQNVSRFNESLAMWKRWTSWHMVAAFHAAAMDALGIEPPMPDISWKALFKPWERANRWLWRWPYFQAKFDIRPLLAVREYRPMDPATSGAKELLRQHGMAIPDIDPWGTGSLESVDGNSLLDTPGLREHWKSKTNPWSH